MTNAPPEQPQSRETGLSIETLIKVAAVLGAASLLLGITYNIAFFAGEKSPWLFYVSAADNLVSTMYALPFGLGVGVITVVGAWYFYRMRPLQFSDWPILALSFGGYGALFFFFWVVQGTSLQERLGIEKVTGTSIILIVGFTAAIFAVAYGASWVIKRAEASGLVGFVALWPIGVFAVLALLGGSALSARGSRTAIDQGKALTVEVEVSQAMQRGVIVGTLVRVLDSGLILAQGEDWLWVPKGDIRRVKERRGSK
ncbi:hypothetical protein [Reyranella sp.]|uniref:hypothetical protein n=1 Tax=Reyranella sp. TaxID=1929291 RepID=UPI003D0D8EEB